MDPRIPQILARWQSADRKPTPEELCASCPELVGQIRQMIDALDSVGQGNLAVETATHTLDPGEHGEYPSDPSSAGPGPAEFPVAAAAEVPSQIGPYRIIATLGSGGMGVVYKAEQRHPVKRLVALKLIKLGMDTRHVIARFESERQALAMMDHPNIARVSDAGATETGRPYFVMEYVPGEPITDYCDRNRLPTEERIRLFIQICEAIQHAHQKGIIHRDLKPGNILVEYRDNRAVPKIIDFGIAKATNASLTEKTLFTEQGQLVGTPEYASPEQAETCGLDVDTRTDIYSLGVILYELLTGKLPFDPKELRSAGYAAMQRIIREEDPPKPSTRLTRLGLDGELQSIAKRRRTEPRTLMRQIRGELDWIILKAMDKDRQRRYETAAALAQDLGRYLRDEPVSAGPPTATYRVSKFIKRHMIGLSAGAAVAAALVIGLLVAIYGLYEARAQRDRAMHATREALAAKGDAERESARSLEIIQYLERMLRATDPEHAKTMDVSLQSVLAKSKELFGDEHAIVAAVLSSRGTALRAAGQLDEAERWFNEALNAYRHAYGPEHGTVAAALASLGSVMRDRGDYVSAESAMRQSLELKKQIFGSNSRAVAEASESLYDVLTLRYGPVGRDKSETRQLLYQVYHAYRDSLGADDRKTVEAMCLLGEWLYFVELDEEAEPMLVSAVESGRRVLGDRSERLLQAMNALTKLYLRQMNSAAAKPMFIELNTMVQGMFGSRNPVTLQTVQQLANFLLGADDLNTAENVLRRAIDATAGAVPRGDAALTQVKGMLVEVMRRQKSVDQKGLRNAWLEYIEDRRIQWGRNDPRLVPLMTEAAASLLNWGFVADAAALYRQAIPIQRAAPTLDQAAVADSLLGLAKAALANYDAAEAEELGREALEIRLRVMDAGDWQVAEAGAVLGEALVALQRYDEAAPLLEEAREVLAGSRLATPDAKYRAMGALVKLYAATGKPRQAEEMRQKMTASSQPATAPAE